MATQEFKLTLRPDDILELYRNDLSFKLFSKENYTNLSFIVLFLILIPLSIPGIYSSKESFFLLLVFICGLGYYIINLLSAYWKIKQKKTTTEKWIDSVAKFKLHRLTVHDDFFKYYRDSETYTYEIANITSMQHTIEYFYCKLIDGDNIILPAKSFETGDYDIFTKTLDEMKNRFAQRTSFKERS